MPKIAVFCRSLCKNCGGRTTRATSVTVSPFYLLGEALLILAVLLVCVHFRHLITDFSPQFSFAAPD